MRRLVLSMLFAAGVALAGPPVSQVDPDPDVTSAWTAYGNGRYEIAAARYLAAASRGHLLAQFNLAVMLIDGSAGEPARVPEGLDWLRKAAEGGLVRAQLALARMYEYGEHLPSSQEAATRWYRQAAEQGSTEARVSLATQYLLGRGAPQDDATAAHWYELAAGQGDAAACYIIASMYHKGHGVPRDGERAIYWYLQAAVRGEAGAAELAGSIREELDTI